MCTDSGHTDFQKFGGECYLWMNEAKTFDEAEAECLKKDSNLVSIHDIGSQLFTFNTVKANDAWIGLSNKKVKRFKSYVSILTNKFNISII